MFEDADARLREELGRLAAAFINLESNRQSMITVTGTLLTEDRKQATVFCSVYPKTDEEAALNFLKRNRGNFRSFLKEKSALSSLPFIDFAIAPELPDIEG